MTQNTLQKDSFLWNEIIFSFIVHHAHVVLLQLKYFNCNRYHHIYRTRTQEISHTVPTLLWLVPQHRALDTRGPNWLTKWECHGLLGCKCIGWKKWSNGKLLGTVTIAIQSSKHLQECMRTFMCDVINMTNRLIYYTYCSVRCPTTVPAWVSHRVGPDWWQWLRLMVQLWWTSRGRRIYHSRCHHIHKPLCRGACTPICSFF
jgi:hypothetical protein